MTIPLAHCQCMPDQQQSLLHFKNSLIYDVSRSSKLITWNNSSDCCYWIGVTCSANGRVLGLDINNESISDGVDNSSSLFRLEHLESLNLANNNELGKRQPVPSAFGLLVNMRYLNLSYTSYSGKIPAEISHLTKLVVLYISHNGFFMSNYYVKLEIPTLNMLVENLTQLRELYLDDVQISEGGSEWCQAISSFLPNLKVLSLSNCNLSGPFHDSFAKLHSLSVINLGRNNIFAPVPTFFANFSNLTSLYLTNCRLQGTFPNAVFRLPSLREIDLSLNENLDGSLPEFTENNDLQKLDLSATKFSGVLPNSIGNLNMLSNIVISVCNFSGSIPKSMANLTRLVELEMHGNKFEGSFPSFSGAKNLVVISLSSNGLTGDISHINWRNLSKLHSLYLDENMLNGIIPSSLFSLPLLESLNLYDNQFSGPFPTISKLSSYPIKYLYLGQNNLEGPIPMSIFNLQDLTILDLSSNNFSGSFLLDDLQHLRNLSELYLSYNNLFLTHDATNASHSFFPQFKDLRLASGKLTTFPYFLRNQPALLTLDLSDNQIKGSIPNWIWGSMYFHRVNLSCNFLEKFESNPINLKYVSYLDLHSNHFHGEIPIFSTRYLTYLDYSRNNFNSTIPDTVGDFMPNLFYFSLASNNLQGIIPESLCIELQVLDMSNNSLSGEIPQCLTALSTLSVLNLRRNNLTSVHNLSPSCSLQTLDISENQMQGELPKSLRNCDKLEVLNLGRNQIAGPFPCFLKTISTLRVLVLRSNHMYGGIECPDNTNGTWPMLQIIDIADNNFDGEVPRRAFATWQAMMTQSIPNQLHFGDKGGNYYQDRVKITIKGNEIELEKILTIFTTIDFSRNKFNGSIPDEIGGLNSLILLNFSNNAFTGAMPLSLRNLSQLESLDLSHNILRGQIPVQLTELIFLSTLILSNNQLEGIIPTSTQFSTFPKSSFEGNKGLFGPPLTEENRTRMSPPATETSPMNYGDEIDWNVISIEVGFICGMTVAIGSLLLCKKWRIWYYRIMYGILVRIFPQLDHWFGRHRRHVYIGARYF